MKFRKINWQFVGTVFIWTGYAVGLVFLLGFAKSKKDELTVKKIQIVIDHLTENFFIDKFEINELIGNKENRLKGSMVNDLNVHQMEKKLVANPYIKNAQVYVDLKGVLNVEVEQRIPMMRIINANYRSFYIDEQGKKMPLSDNYTANVLVANGAILEGYGGIIDTLKSKQLKDIYTLGDYITKNEFWNAQIEQIYVKDDGDLVLIPRVGNHKIIFGDIEMMQEKFENLMIFYERAFPRVGWNTYQIINVKYKNQIVCSK